MKNAGSSKTGSDSETPSPSSPRINQEDSGSSVHARWIAWVGMLVGLLFFAGSDVYAATQEEDGRRVTASSWVRYVVRRSFGVVGIVGVGWVIWHFVVQAWFPDLPL